MMVTSSTYWQMLQLLRYAQCTFFFLLFCLLEMIVCIGNLYHLQFQYGNPDVLCAPLVEAKKNGTYLVVSSTVIWKHDVCSFQELRETTGRQLFSRCGPWLLFQLCYHNFLVNLAWSNNCCYAGNICSVRERLLHWNIWGISCIIWSTVFEEHNSCWIL